MIKFSHSIFAMPFAIMAAFLAGNGSHPGFFGWQRLILIVCAMVFARSAAMTFNRIVDAKFDSRNPRTADRAIPSGKLTSLQAWIFLCVCAILFLATAALFYYPLGSLFGFRNPWPLIFAIPVLLFICAYSYTKRFTWASHLWLGASLMCAPLGAWIAIKPLEGPMINHLPALLLALAVLLWTAGFDIIYACQDIDIDKREGLFSMPASIGIPLAMRFSKICHSSCVTMLFLLAIFAKLGPIYLGTVVIISLLLIVEHYLVYKGKTKIAFATINGIISLSLALGTILDIMTK